MKLNEKTSKLICLLEYNIGNQCYNPNSYDGWADTEGCEFRYPVCALDKPEDTELKKFRGNVSKNATYISENTVKSMMYRFGSNHLYIGLGIRDLLNALEERYGIDFEKLENEFLERENL
ncbi:MAG: hypothetical protein IKK51_03900 [Oscillospiraceae bacterium]|nr:hypothetical protein [Oscillospiraceae bacterium]